jgi:hypothetical protein
MLRRLTEWLSSTSAAIDFIGLRCLVCSCGVSLQRRLLGSDSAFLNKRSHYLSLGEIDEGEIHEEAGIVSTSCPLSRKPLLGTKWKSSS